MSAGLQVNIGKEYAPTGMDGDAVEREGRFGAERELSSLVEEWGDRVRCGARARGHDTPTRAADRQQSEEKRTLACLPNEAKLIFCFQPSSCPSTRRPHGNPRRRGSGRGLHELSLCGLGMSLLPAQPGSPGALLSLICSVAVASLVNPLILAGSNLHQESQLAMRERA